MILPEEPIRGLTFKKYLELVWERDDEGEMGTIAMLALDLSGRDEWEMKALPDAIQVYWFERGKNVMVRALGKIK